MACGILVPRPGLEPACPALAGRLSTTAPPGKPRVYVFEGNILVLLLFIYIAGIEEKELFKDLGLRGLMQEGGGRRKGLLSGPEHGPDPVSSSETVQVCPCVPPPSASSKSAPA